MIVNHVLNTKRGRLEPAAMAFQCYGHGLDETPDVDLPDQQSVPADVRLLVDEARLTCPTDRRRSHESEKAHAIESDLRSDDLCQVSTKSTASTHAPATRRT